MDQIFGTLARLETTQSHVERIPDAALTKTQVSPWLERTRWLHYLKGVPLDKAAKLARLPLQHDEPILYEIGLAVDRLVEAAHLSLREEKVNFFRQKRITSLLPDREVYSRPLVYKLQEATYKQYKQSWKRALAFFCRTSDPRQEIAFEHSLNTRQTALLDHVLALATKQAAEASSASEPLDHMCLDFCLSLLEQPLRGNIFESPLVGFLAVMGIDENNDTLHEAPRYTPKLSAFIKIAQLLVLQKSVILAQEGLVQDPLNPLDEMREIHDIGQRHTFHLGPAFTILRKADSRLHNVAWIYEMVGRRADYQVPRHRASNTGLQAICATTSAERTAELRSIVHAWNGREQSRDRA
jgi:hypothetical protein